MNKSASTGWGLKGKKGEYYDLVRDTVDRLRREEFDFSEVNFPAIIFRRIQASKKYGYKDRQVYGPTLLFTVIEMMFGLDFTDYLMETKDSDIRYGDTNLVTQKLIKDLSKYYKVPVDFASFDQTIPSEVIFTSLALIRSCMDLSDYESKIFTSIIGYVVAAPIYCESTGLVNRQRGIISGSYFTNCVDSMVNTYVLHYADYFSRVIHRLPVYGDDNIICTISKYFDKRQLHCRLSKIGMSAETNTDE
jgi:hypothetical protein